jgi:stage II sporulation protein GA (sporulation sigma-E factor processing peptidase)
MQTVYIDSYFLVNLIVNYIMLIVTAKICAVPARRLRLAGAAAAGAAYAVASLIPAAAFLTNPFVKVAFGILMALAAFGGCARLLRTMLVFFAVSAAFGGVVMAASLLGGGSLYGGLFTSASLRVLIVSFAVGYVILTLVFRRAARHKGGVIVSVTVRHGGREVAVRALLGTGNALSDPLSGRPVMGAGVGDLRPLFTPDVAAALAGLDRKGAVRVLEELSEGKCPIRFQLIPYSAVGVSGGMLLAFRPDEIVVDGKAKSGMLLALSPNSVSEGGTYSALIGA